MNGHPVLLVPKFGVLLDHSLSVGSSDVIYGIPLRQNFRPAAASGYSRAKNGRNGVGGSGDDAHLDAPTTADTDAVSIAAPSLSASVGALETSMWSCGHFTLTLLHLVQGGSLSTFDHFAVINLQLTLILCVA